jgi:hypothetical protein
MLNSGGVLRPAGTQLESMHRTLVVQFISGLTDLVCNQRVISYEGGWIRTSIGVQKA